MNGGRATKLRYLEMAMNDGETSQIRAKVFAVIPEYDQAMLHADGDRHLTITRHTEGVALEDVREGQVYLLTVTHRFSRVLRAQLVVPEQIVVDPSKPT